MTTPEINALVEKKLPLVQADYESYHASSTRVMDRINSMHTWEITLLAAFIALASQHGALNFATATPMIFVIATFALSEAGQLAALRAINYDVLRIEALLQEEDPGKFNLNIVSWKFGNTLVRERQQTEKYRMVKEALFSRRLLLWHGTLAIAMLGLAYTLR